MNSNNWLFTLIFLLATQSCSGGDETTVAPTPPTQNGNPAATPSEIQTLRKEIEDLKKKVEALSTQATAQRDMVGSVSETVAFILQSYEGEVRWSETTILKPGISGFGVLAESDGLGVFTAAIEDVQPYLTGYKLTLRIGNPMHMNCTAYTVTIQSSRAVPPTDDVKPATHEERPDAAEQWLATFRDRQKSLRTTTVRLTNPILLAGSRTSVEVYIPDVAAIDVGQFEVSIDVHEINFATLLR